MVGEHIGRLQRHDVVGSRLGDFLGKSDVPETNAGRVGIRRSTPQTFRDANIRYGGSEAFDCTLRPLVQA